MVEATTPTRRTATPLSLTLAVALACIGIATLVGFGLQVVNDAGMRDALDTSLGAARPSPVIAFLDAFGIVLPLAMLVFGALAIVLGLRVARRRVAAMRTGRDALSWLAILGAVVAIARIVQGTPLLAPADAHLAALAGGALGPALAAGVALALRWGMARLARQTDLPDESLVNREARAAWNLLVPALLILVVVAARPLEATIITSLTDKRFASDQVPNFVGLQHYRTLLTVRFDEVVCRRADDGSCARSASGAIRWETLPRERLAEGYRTAWNLNVPLVSGPDTALSISALDRTWIRSIWVTLVFTVASVSLELVLGLFIALTVHSEFRGRGAMRAVMLVPWAIPTVVSARLWELMLKDTSAGVVNRALMMSGIIDTPQAWLTTSALQIPSAIMIDVWKTAPFMALLLLAGLQVIPKELYESARVDGASRVREFLSITLPLLRPAIAVALIFRTLDALRVFDLFNVLFGRSEHSVSTYNFEVLINNQEAGYASAIGVLIFVLIFGFAVLYVRFLGVNRS